MTSKNNTANVYQPKVGLRNHQFVDVSDICELRSEMDRAVESRREDAMMTPGGWL